MKTYRINFVANFSVEIEAANEADVRIKAETLADDVLLRQLPGMPLNCAWNTIRHVGGDDD